MANNKCAVIVAAYNEEENIARCLSSILDQNYRDLEIIVVDDGSTDNTSDIIKYFSENNKNISYFFQENMGAAAARRNGIMCCSSEYVTFLDADDSLSEDAIALAMAKIDESVDIVLYNLVFSRSGSTRSIKYFTADKEFTGLSALNNSLPQWRVHGCGIFRKDIFLDSYRLYDKYNPGNVNFVNNDEVITRLNFFHARKVRLCDGIYFYNFNDKSTTNRVNPNFIKILNNTDILLNIFRDNNILVNESEILASDINLCFKKIKRGSALQNLSEWKLAIRSRITKIFFRGGVNLKIKLRLLKIFIKTYMISVRRH